MAFNVISLIALALCHARHALADVRAVAQLGNSMSKTFVPTGQIPRLSGSVLSNPAAAVALENVEVVAGSRFPVHQAPCTKQQIGSIFNMGEALKEQEEEQKEVYQHLRSHMQKMPQADAKDGQYGFGLGSLMGLMASMGLVAAISFAAARKYFAHGQHALHSTVDSQISFPQRSRPIEAMIGDAESFTLADLQKQAGKLNLPVGNFDPLSLSHEEWDNDATIGFLRHAEIKHGRVAMVGCVGYIVHENGIRWPSVLTGDVLDYSSFQGLSAPDVWDNIPFVGQLQIVLTIGFFEFWSEMSYFFEEEGENHYMCGGKPGYFATVDELPHPALHPNGSDEWKSERLLTEVNTGRLAMIGLMSFLSEAKVPGSVPLLNGLIKPYAGDTLASFRTQISLPELF